ncbi:MAG: chemotaxis protein CheW [Bryobacteraceae bacterium]
MSDENTDSRPAPSRPAFLSGLMRELLEKTAAPTGDSSALESAGVESARAAPPENGSGTELVELVPDPSLASRPSVAPGWAWGGDAQTGFLEPPAFETALEGELQAAAVEEAPQTSPDYRPELTASSPGPAPAEGATGLDPDVGPDAGHQLDALIAGIDRDVARTPLPSTPHPDREGKLDQCVLFSLDGARYALPLDDVVETGRVPAITRLPRVPSYVRGVSNLRGEIVVVFDLRSMLGLDPPATAAHGRMLLVRVGEDSQHAALIVDAIGGIGRAPAGSAQPPAGPVEDPVADVISGVIELGGEGIALIHIGKLFQALPRRGVGAKSNVFGGQ